MNKIVLQHYKLKKPIKLNFNILKFNFILGAKKYYTLNIFILSLIFVLLLYIIILFLIWKFIYPPIADYIYREYFDPNYGFKSLPSSKDYDHLLYKNFENTGRHHNTIIWKEIPIVSKKPRDVL